jgi:NifB/MoaA-like Fe-S oxidoreductase
MIPKYRKQFNQEFSQEKYNQFKEILEQKSGLETGFRISESPLFLTKEFESKLIDASESIITRLKIFLKKLYKRRFLITAGFPTTQSSLTFSR